MHGEMKNAARRLLWKYLPSHMARFGLFLRITFCTILFFYSPASNYIELNFFLHTQ